MRSLTNRMVDSSPEKGQKKRANKKVIFFQILLVPGKRYKI